MIKEKNLSGFNVIGLDLGPITIAIVCAKSQKATITPFADELKENAQLKKKLQRQIAKKRSIGNPKSFHPDSFEKKDKHWFRKLGKNKKGGKLSYRSNRLIKVKNKLVDLQRKEAAFRKSQHGKLINQILKQGNHVKTEKLSYKSFQKNFGKSVGFRAPGMFLEMLRCKAENAGGQVEEFNTYSTALSQTCHCGTKTKNKPSKRWHVPLWRRGTARPL